MDVSLATHENLDDVMIVEHEAFSHAGFGTIASRELMAERIALCNGMSPGWFFVAVDNGTVHGYAIFQPTRLEPHACTSWEASTDNGTLRATFDADGETVFGVSIGTRDDAPAHTADMLLRAMLRTCVVAGKKRFAFCSRLPGYRAAAAQGVSADRYWQLKRSDGAPEDWLLRYFFDVLGVHPCKFLRDGFVVDEESGGHAALVVVEDFAAALASLNRRIPA